MSHNSRKGLVTGKAGLKPMLGGHETEDMSATVVRGEGYHERAERLALATEKLKAARQSIKSTRTKKKFQSVVYDALERHQEEKAAATKLQAAARGFIARKEVKYRKAAQEIEPSTDDAFDCDRWAADFQEKLGHQGLEFEGKKLILRRNNGSQAPNAEIRKDGTKVGLDTHYFTQVSIAGKNLVFDNLHTKGIERRDHNNAFTFHLKPVNDRDRYSDATEQVPRAGNVRVQRKLAKDDR